MLTQGRDWGHWGCSICPVNTKETLLHLHTSAPNSKTQHFTESTFPHWFCKRSVGIKMLSPWETPLKLSLCVIYTENKMWAKNHRECLFKHNSRGPWKMIKAFSLFTNTQMFRKKKTNNRFFFKCKRSFWFWTLSVIKYISWQMNRK